MEYLAQVVPPRQGIDVIDGVATIKGFEWVFGNVISVLIGFAAIALFIMIIVGGFGYMTSAGDPKKAESAKNTITYAIGGLILVVLAYLIILLIQNITGINLSDFLVSQ